ncbi:glutamate 5-kinase [Paenibacillus senegalensis]|uniref:glutamate 5-kinase n=1 Tax=Paenibacillus senegalensis TaxID=1465766 RepID=UPI000289D79C|nr:glutamate 5-kinase [Paenibacillus senegalensis]
MQPRTVVKIGSSSLTYNEGGLHYDKIRYFIGEVADLRKRGQQVLVVTSGAVAAGFATIGYKRRPRILKEKQAAAAVGQALLMQCYQQELGRLGIPAAQILLTRSDFSNRKRALNALMTIEELLARGVIPVINENDTVSVDELKFGDNDTLSALVANLVKADKLLILTDTDGLYTDDPRKNADAVRIDRVDQISEELLKIAGGSGSAVGTGGMRSKIEAARIAMRGGVPVFVGRATEPGDLWAAWCNQGKGTYFDTKLHTLPMKKQWVGFHSFPKGSIIVDHGAETALLKEGRSLLPAGVQTIAGEFHPGDVIEVMNRDQQAIGRGVVNYSSWQLQAVAGLSTEEVKKRVDVPRIEVIHRDEWMSLN